MANKGVTGQFVDEDGKGLEYYIVVALDIQTQNYKGKVTQTDVLMGSGVIKSNGDYRIMYSELYEGKERKPNIRFRVYDPVLRLVFESKETYPTSDPIFSAPTIKIRKADADGYIVTLLKDLEEKEGKKQYPMLSYNNQFEFLIDNKKAWEELTKSIQNAKVYINSAQLYFDVGDLKIPVIGGSYNKPYIGLITVFDPEMPIYGIKTTGLLLEDELYKANVNNKVSVRLVLNNFMIINNFMEEPYPANTFSRVNNYYNKRKIIDGRTNTVEVRPFNTPYRRAMHAKFTVIDGNVAILNASPLMQEYFDDIGHMKIDDPRRGSMGVENSICVPVHDVSAKIKGPALTYLLETFDILWRQTEGSSLGITPPDPFDMPWRQTGGSSLGITPLDQQDDQKPIAVQIVRTLPGNTFTTNPGAAPDGELGIMEAYLRAFKQAKNLVYIENQYITIDNQPVIDRKEVVDIMGVKVPPAKPLFGIVPQAFMIRSLLLALYRNPDLQVIILTNNKVDVPFYQPMQVNVIQRFLDKVHDNRWDNRVGVFTRWTHDASTTPQRIIRNYIHAKVGIVDNKWATIGSANMDGVSMKCSQHLVGDISNEDLLQERAVELNAVVYNGVDGMPSSDIPDSLRRELWAEHLGIPVEHKDLNWDPDPNENREKFHWFNLWNNAAEAKEKRLKESPPTAHPASILKWRGEPEAKNYLKALGIESSKYLKIEENVKSFDVIQGTWKMPRN